MDNHKYLAFRKKSKKIRNVPSGSTTRIMSLSSFGDGSFPQVFSTFSKLLMSITSDPELFIKSNKALNSLDKQNKR